MKRVSLTRNQQFGSCSAPNNATQLRGVDEDKILKTLRLYVSRLNP